MIRPGNWSRCRWVADIVRGVGGATGGHGAPVLAVGWIPIRMHGAGRNDSLRHDRRPDLRLLRRLGRRASRRCRAADNDTYPSVIHSLACGQWLDAARHRPPPPPQGLLEPARPVFRVLPPYPPPGPRSGIRPLATWERPSRRLLAEDAYWPARSPASCRRAGRQQCCADPWPAES